MNVAVIGCGVVGAAIAYELSQVPDFQVQVLDRHFPAQAATGAALGVLMGAISQKTKGNNLHMRLASIQRYNDWVPELEAKTGRRILFNRQGILRLCFAGEDLTVWQKLATVRQAQGWHLEMYDRSELTIRYPQLSGEGVIAAVYSPDDRQLDPTALTLALVDAAQQNGVQFQFGTEVMGIEVNSDSSQAGVSPAAPELQPVRGIRTTTGFLAADWVVIAAGLGSTPLTTQLQQPVDIRPVLGQALRLCLSQPMGYDMAQPVITGNDVHIVPLENGEYWIGATVEFPEAPTPLTPDPARLESVRHAAIALCPALAEGTIVQQWSGLRPRPEGRPAPIIERLPGYQNVLLAAGHYRNGILLAPATAEKVRQMIERSPV